jgi:hypothetical protein
MHVSAAYLLHSLLVKVSLVPGWVLLCRALQHAQLTASHAALLLVRLCMWLERASQQLLGRRLAASLSNAVAAARDILVRRVGVAEILALPEGLAAPLESFVVLEHNDVDVDVWDGSSSSSSSSSSSWASRWLAGEGDDAAAAGMEDASAAHVGASTTSAATPKARAAAAAARGKRGAAAVDVDASSSSSSRPGGARAAAAAAARQVATADNIMLTILLGALAGVLWRRQRRIVNPLDQ